METNSKGFSYYYQSKELIRQEISILEDEMGDRMAEDGKVIGELN